MQGNRILLVVGGGIAAFKVPELIRLLRLDGMAVTPVLTKAGAEFVTPLTLSALAENPCHQELFDLTRESEMGHIQLSRAADLVVVVPATANLMARMAAGIADDLATTLLLATDKPVLIVPATANLMAKMVAGIADDLATTLLLATDKLVMIAPAMNVRMWEHPATRRNRRQLQQDGILFVGPGEGVMACGEYGDGRMAEPATILEAIRAQLGRPADAPTRGAGLPPLLLRDDEDPAEERPLRLPPEAVVKMPSRRVLAGKHVVVTSGPTHEPIDPVRYIANRSSGAQGTAIAAALRQLGARVTFVTGPASVPPPEGVDVVAVETAAEMREAVERALPADVAVMAAAVADWRVANARDSKIKKDGSGQIPALEFAENPDILAWISHLDDSRPALVVGFAAETDDVLAHATAKRLRKGCDWIVANDVHPSTGIMGGQENAVILITESGAEHWPRMAKTEVAGKLADRIAEELLAAQDGRTPEEGL